MMRAARSSRRRIWRRCERAAEALAKAGRARHRDQHARHDLVGGAADARQRRRDAGRARPRPHRHDAAPCRAGPAGTSRPSSISARSRICIGSEAFCFGGGLYIDPVFPAYQVKAIVSREPTSAVAALAPVDIPPPAAIDYYGMIDATGRGEAARRRQRRLRLSPAGLRDARLCRRRHRPVRRAHPIVETIHDAFGRPADWPM